MDINNFYKIKKIEVCLPKKTEYIEINNMMFLECIKIILDKNVSTCGPYQSIYTIYTKNGTSIDYGWKFVDNIYYYSTFDPFTLGKIMPTNNRYLKEGDYLYINNIAYISKKEEEENLWKILGNLENPDLELIELCTSMLNK